MVVKFPWWNSTEGREFLSETPMNLAFKAKPTKIICSHCKCCELCPSNVFHWIRWLRESHVFCSTYDSFTYNFWILHCLFFCLEEHNSSKWSIQVESWRSFANCSPISNLWTVFGQIWRNDCWGKEQCQDFCPQPAKIQF
jgi:NAD-dependent dihydropyrimidine dehydrogenase PreA subunit